MITYLWDWDNDYFFNGYGRIVVVDSEPMDVEIEDGIKKQPAEISFVIME